jgi:2-octaprenylphenol hydroxylase
MYGTQYKMQNIYDVLIVGGGMVGASLACALEKSQYRIGLLELNFPQALQNDVPVEVNDFDRRVSAITAASQQFLANIGVWDCLPKNSLSGYQHMKVWDGEGTGEIEFHADEIGEPCLGHIVENRVTINGLFTRLKTCRQVELLQGQLSMIDEANDNGVQVVTLEDGQKIQARLIVGADGALSKVRQITGIPLAEWDYNHTAIVATVKTEKSHQHTAWQNFLSTGPLAFLPLASAEDNISSIVWSVESSRAEELLSLDTESFNHALTMAIEGRLGAVLEVSDKFSFPLRQRHAKSYVLDGCVLIGDAAHTIHPLAGQGVNLGFMDAAVLAEELIGASEIRMSPVDDALLARFQRRRKLDNMTMTASMEAFKRLFEADPLPIRWARNLGMKLLNKTPAIKNHIVMQAMGLNGAIPKLAKRR